MIPFAGLENLVSAGWRHGDAPCDQKKRRAHHGPASLEARATGVAGYMGSTSILYHAIRHGRLKGNCRRTVNYRARFARVNCKKLQFTGIILPVTDCGDEPYGKFAPRHHGEGSNDRRRNDTSITAPVNP